MTSGHRALRVEIARVVLERGGLWTVTAVDNHAHAGKTACLGAVVFHSLGQPRAWRPGGRCARLSTPPHRPDYWSEISVGLESRRLATRLGLRCRALAVPDRTERMHRRCAADSGIGPKVALQ